MTDDLKYGSKGAAVSDMQHRLNLAGTKPALDVSGDFDHSTCNAVQTFQVISRLPVTGEADAATIEALRLATVDLGD